ncbi:MAG: hypothetical protein BECKG1743D_GA0114223_110171 [Candidatus Kentron sp. G]|nr:MAG: hypothetical protein BECKG1743F_GA0114225_108301 [Candidatus Kentron sp. G]VFN07239.1 MAG: hypothetical protein BECKG1743D_GA0114223_110171 [Candidatus Kentron sp. G]
MLIYFHGNFPFSLQNFTAHGASLWDTIRLLHIYPKSCNQGEFM